MQHYSRMCTSYFSKIIVTFNIFNQPHPHMKEQTPNKNTPQLYICLTPHSTHFYWQTSWVFMNQKASGSPMGINLRPTRYHQGALYHWTTLCSFSHPKQPNESQTASSDIYLFNDTLTTFLLTDIFTYETFWWQKPSGSVTGIDLKTHGASDICLHHWAMAAHTPVISFTKLTWGNFCLSDPSDL